MNALADRRTVGEVVTRLYTAAGRKATDLELRLYAEVLEGVEASVADEASRRMVAGEDWRWRPPSPALLLSYVRDVRLERRQRQSAIPSDTGPVLPPDVQRQLLARVRSRHQLTRGGDPRPLAASLPRFPAGAHELGDHQFCDPGCQPPPEERA